MAQPLPSKPRNQGGHFATGLRALESQENMGCDSMAQMGMSQALALFFFSTRNGWRHAGRYKIPLYAELQRQGGRENADFLLICFSPQTMQPSSRGLSASSKLGPSPKRKKKNFTSRPAECASAPIRGSHRFEVSRGRRAVDYSTCSHVCLSLEAHQIQPLPNRDAPPSPFPPANPRFALPCLVANVFVFIW
jgi:hypothetical protein